MIKIVLPCLALLVFASCSSQKTDAEIFDEGRLMVNLSADQRKGTEPLHVHFAAYLETEERTVDRKIEEVKWIIRGPGRFYREIENESYNYQEEDQNEENFFYLDYDFYRPGYYSVRVILNDGEFASPPYKITVFEDPAKKANRY